MGKRFAIVIGVAAAGVMALGAQTAAAAPFDTRLTITTERGFIYHGWVNSEVERCERRRHVGLFKQRPGADRKLGGALSVGDKHDGLPAGGVWGMIEARGVHGHAYARVRPKVLPNRRCGADRTPIYDGHPDVAGRV